MEAYPLQWPAAWPRSEEKLNARFKVTMAVAVQELYDELERLGAEDIVISSNMRLRLDGRPLADQKRMDDEGVAVYFTYNGTQQCIPCDKWNSVKDNVRAIGLTVEALRSLERHGAKAMVNAAFKGFTALPAGMEAEQWWQVLDLDGPTKDATEITTAYRQKIKAAHPDHGGSDAEFKRVQRAYETGKTQSGVF